MRDSREGPQLGAQLLVPMERDDAATVLVDLGWVPENRPQPMAIPKGATSIEGYVRPAEHRGLFSASDDSATRQFYTLVPQAIGAALGLQHVAPFTLVVMRPTPAAGYPDPA